MALSDVVAARVMGELHTLTTKIDDQNRIITNSTAAIKSAAELVKVNSDQAVKNATEATRQAQLASLAHFEASMATAVSRTLNDVAGAVATKSAAKWVIGGVACAGLLAVLAGGIGYMEGKDAGDAVGYAKARDEIAASSWANTPDGRLAYQLARVESIESLVRCNRPGWFTENGFCFVKQAKDGKIYGWRISQ